MFLTPRQYFQLQGAKPRKRFGQHFLAQPATAQRIVASAAPQAEDVAVEVGPGLGALTQFILPRVGRLHLVEVDRDLAGYLQRVIDASSYPCQVHCQDILTFDFAATSRQAGQRLLVLGNLPYNISSPLVFHLLESRAAIKRAVFMVQKEVGERLAASPGSKTYGVLSVLLGVYGQVSKLFYVSPRLFHPPPQVESVVIRLDFPQACGTDDPKLFKFFRHVVNTAFQQRRKTLHNSLRPLVGKNREVLDQALQACAIDPKRRPETLSPQEFLQLAQTLRSDSATL